MLDTACEIEHNYIYTVPRLLPRSPWPKKMPSSRTLQQQGTLNPRPSAVTDELFLQDSFFDPRDLVQVKYEMLRRVQTEGQSVTDAAANFRFLAALVLSGASRPSSKTVLPAWCPTNAVPSRRTSSPTRSWHSLVEMRQKEPSVPIAGTGELIQERFGTKVHPRSIERSLLRHQKKRR